MTHLLLLRHGQSEWNAQGRWQGQADPPLSTAGREEAKIAAEVLSAFSGRFFSSPLIRARATATIISEEVGDGVVHVEIDLREIDVGDFSGLTNHQIEERMPKAWASLRAGELHVFPGGEARHDFRDRVLSALESLARRHPGEEIVVVTHGGAIGAIERHLGVFPGVGVKNLEGRWFEVNGSSVEADGDRVKMLSDQDN